MVFEFAAHSNFNFLTSFAEQFNAQVLDDTLIIPASMGEGCIKKVELGPNFKLLIHRYTFKEDFVLKRMAPEQWHDQTTIIFYSSTLSSHLLSNPERAQFYCKNYTKSAIEISSADLNSEIRFPANTEIYFTVIGAKSATLIETLQVEKPHHLLESIRNSHTYLYYETMWLEVEKVLKQLCNINAQHELSHFNYKIKVQELLYLLFSKLLKRENEPVANINKADIEKIFAVRNLMLADLSAPPQLSTLAKMSNLSETKMKQLFKQVFGDSIYNYYQKARMEEAAFLLKQASFSVSDVGYELGFSNLSHFSRLFQRHYGITPKKYTVAG